MYFAESHYVGLLLFSSTIRYLAYYYLFGLFWTWNLIMAIGQCTTAGAFATWYWTRDKAVRILLGCVRCKSHDRFSFGSMVNFCRSLETAHFDRSSKLLSYHALPFWLFGFWLSDYCHHSILPFPPGTIRAKCEKIQEQASSLYHQLHAMLSGLH
jgi:hypothetical protein